MVPLIRKNIYLGETFVFLASELRPIAITPQGGSFTTAHPGGLSLACAGAKGVKGAESWRAWVGVGGELMVKNPGLMI